MPIDTDAVDARTVSTLLVALGFGVMVTYTGATAVLAGGGPGWSADEPVVVGVQGPGSNGVVEAYDETGELLWRVGGAASYHDITQLEDGRVLAAYATGGHSDCGAYDPPCGRTGVRILEPDPETRSASIVAEWSYPVRDYTDSEVHDVEPLPNGRVLVVGMDRERVFTVNVTTGDVEPIWNASSYYDPPADPTTTDWLHMNDVDRIGEDRYLVSVRNENQLVVLEDGHVAEVINADGDPTVMRDQHNPQWLGTGAVLVSDSSNGRVVELHRSENGTWEVAWAVGGANGMRFAWPRDADRLPNGHTLVTDSRNNRLVEVAENGSVVGILRTSALPYEADYADAGEPVVGAVYDAQDTIGAGAGGEGLVGVRGIHMAWVGISHTLPVPYWMTEWHLVAFIVGAVLVDLGAAVRWWAWARERDWSLRGGESDAERAQFVPNFLLLGLIFWWAVVVATVEWYLVPVEPGVLSARNLAVTVVVYLGSLFVLGASSRVLKRAGNALAGYRPLDEDRGQLDPGMLMRFLTIALIVAFVMADMILRPVGLLSPLNLAVGLLIYAGILVVGGVAYAVLKAALGEEEDVVAGENRGQLTDGPNIFLGWFSVVAVAIVVILEIPWWVVAALGIVVLHAVWISMWARA